MTDHGPGSPDWKLESIHQTADSKLFWHGTDQSSSKAIPYLFRLFVSQSLRKYNSARLAWAPDTHWILQTPHRLGPHEPFRQPRPSYRLLKTLCSSNSRGWRYFFHGSITSRLSNQHVIHAIQFGSSLQTKTCGGYSYEYSWPAFRCLTCSCRDPSASL